MKPGPVRAIGDDKVHGFLELGEQLDGDPAQRQARSN
jgi:hypothetical protein